MDKVSTKEKSPNPPSFSIKFELFDHAIYPLSIKLDENNIIAAFTRLHIMTSIDYNITLDDWIKISNQYMNGLPQKEAEILFYTFKIFSSGFDSDSSSHTSKYEPEEKNSVDVRLFGLFIALQLYVQKAKSSISVGISDDKVNWQHTNTTNTIKVSSQINSPRGKNAYRNSMSSMENSIIVNFIKNNLRLFLKLISSDIHNTNTTLKASEFNTLSFLFKVNEKKTTSTTISKLSSYAQFFANFSSTTKISVDMISEWLYGVININASEYDDLVVFKGLSKSVTVKEKDSHITGKHVKITSCDDSYIYLNTNVLSLKINNCTNCTIFVATASKIISIDKCEGCNICIATNLLRISNTIDTRIYSYILQKPILYGDNRGLMLGPHNVFYSEITNFLKAAKIALSKSYLNNWKEPILMNNSQDSKSIYDIIAPQDFSRFITPFTSNNDNQVFLANAEYVTIIKEKDDAMEKIKTIIKDANLFEEQEKALHVAIQGYFREWLSNSGNVKNITDVIKMMDLSNFQSDN